MRIVICGAGSTGRHVARVLSDVHEVMLIDRLHSRAAPDVPGARFIAGDAADPAILLQAGAQDANAVLAVTRDDPTNLTIALLAKHRFRVASTVARVNDPAHAWLFTPPAGVDVVVSAAELIARLVQEEVTAGDLVTLLRLRGGGIAVTETRLPAGASVAGLPASQLDVPEGVVLTAVVRYDEVLIPDRAGPLRAGDTIVALCEPGREHLLHELLTGLHGGGAGPVP